MEQRKSLSPTSPLKVLSIIGALTFCCCAIFSIYFLGLFIMVDQDISVIPTQTLDLACEDSSCLNACIRRMPDFDMPSLYEHRAELLKQQFGYELARYRLEPDGTLKRIAIPTVPEYLKPHQENLRLHQRIWDYFSGIFPNDDEVHVSYMVVYVDLAEDQAAASIWELDGKWRLYVNLAYFDSPRNVIDILTHEYGHMLTLNAKQTRPAQGDYGLEMERKDFDEMVTSCEGDFFTGYECAISDSYLNEFGSRFWTGDVYETWITAFLTLDKDEGMHDEEIQKFYALYPDQFVTEYAATNPVEDLAESWTEFVLRPKPSGSGIADQKVLFFYEYPELVELRRTILRGVCQYASDQK